MDAEEHDRRERARYLAKAELEKMPWGRYRGVNFREVPSDYLRWLVATARGKVACGGLVSSAQWVLESRAAKSEGEDAPK